MEDTNIQPGYIGQQHLYGGLMSDAQSWRFMGRTGGPSRLADKKLEEDVSDESMNNI
ncbi:hypothetical protein ACLOJK_014595 [Asimina triloba]